MNICEAIQIFRDTNCYGTMSIAKSVILNYLQDMSDNDNMCLVSCKNCKYFEYDNVETVCGIPLIIHEICSRWGNGCKTREDGYCFLFEPQESEE